MFGQQIELKIMFLILPFVEGSDSDGDLNGGHGCGREGPWKVRTFVDNQYQTFLALPPQNHPTTQIIIWLMLLLLTLNTNIWCWFTITKVAYQVLGTIYVGFGDD